MLPLLHRKNTFTWRFLPGLLVGALLQAWFQSGDKEQPSVSKPGTTSAKKTAATAVETPQEELKMVLLVNQELKMGKGKIGAQCAHAAVGVVQKFGTKQRTWFKQWELMGQKKVALKVDSTAELRALEQQAKDAGLPYYTVRDAGRTQIAAGSCTVLAVGPGPDSRVNAITGKLGLL